ncbi:putative serine protease family S33 [Phytophthora cinnamomi]|uniref:putative serine protease family S33 n=1 Tax=Phytophthora cinnamomi TaxID=4785 RepID=UPI00355987F6|nr:putative serine protease family S33 [Phytophthora cinnamomi]
MATRGRVNSALRAQHMPAHLRHLEGKFKNARGQSLSYLALFPPASTPLRAVVLYLHGIGDHSRRYFHLYERLCAAGFGVLAYDLLSHGASDSDRHGLRAHSAHFQYFVDDTNEFVTLAKTQLYPQLALNGGDEPKLVLSGMSYGTLVSLHTILSGKHSFSGVVLVAPALLVEMTTTLRVQAVFARPLSKLLPKARIVPGVNEDFLCRDQGYLTDFRADPLTVSEPVTARMGAETLKAMRALEADKRVEDKDSALCKLPMLMMMGSNDKVTSLELAKVFYDRLAAQDKEFKIFEDYFHALFDDPESEAVFVFLDNWLKKRFPVPEGAETVDKIEEGDEANAESAEESAKEEKKVEAVVKEEVKAEAAAKEETKVETIATEVETVVTEDVKVEAAVAETVASEETKVAAVVTEEKEVEAVVVEEAKVESVASVVAEETKVETVEKEEKESEAVVKEDAEVAVPEVETIKSETVEEGAKEEIKAGTVVENAEIENAATEDAKVEVVATATIEAADLPKAEPVVTKDKEVEVAVPEEKQVEATTEVAVNEETKAEVVEASGETSVAEEVKAEAIKSSVTEQTKIETDGKDTPAKDEPAAA